MCRAIAQVKLVLCTVMLQIRAGLFASCCLANNTIEALLLRSAKAYIYQLLQSMH